MDLLTALSETSEKRAAARSEPRALDLLAPGLEARGRAPPELSRLADGLLKMLESERARVSQVLGDEVISVMTMARYLIEDAAQRLARSEFDETSEALQNASARIRDATHQLVGLCSELRPRVLDDLGLVAALAWYFREFSQKNRAIFVSPRITIAESDIPPDLKLAIFRIVQAALSNVAEHSKASAVRVFLSLFEDELRLGIEDNGVGFDVERWRHRRYHGHDGCGLGIVCRWAETSGGRCSIEAIPRHGARVQVFWRAPLFAASTAAPAPSETDATPGATSR
jgi:two-component system, NarL family, sensor kinase